MAIMKEVVRSGGVPDVSFGIEFIWLIEDYYEHKNLQGFLSLLCDEYDKRFNSLKTKLKDQFDAYEDIKLFLYLRSKILDLDLALHAYEVCWSRRCKKFKSNMLEKKSGTATIILKKMVCGRRESFYLFDIKGDNPFVQ